MDIVRDRDRYSDRGYNDTKIEAELERRRTGEEPSQMDCFLDVTADLFVIDMMKNILDKFKTSYWYFQRGEVSFANTFISPPAIQTAIKTAIQSGMPAAAIQTIPVLLISLHGGLPVLRKKRSKMFSYNYKTFFSKSFFDFERLIKTPNGCCSFIRPHVRQQYFDEVTDILKKSSVSDPIIETIKQKLFSLSFDLQEECLTLKRTETITESIFECRSRAFEIVNTKRNDKVINKLWTPDVYNRNDEFKNNHKLAPRGILFCNDVVITLPNNWDQSRYDISDFSSDYQVADINDDSNVGVYTFKRKFDEYKGLPEYYRHEYEATYQIGVYTPGTPKTATALGTPGKIYYRAGTNLLSCPYFMQFASERLGNNIINLNNSLSLGQNNMLLIPMVTQITAEVLYGFLQNQRFLSIDMSCESLMIYDEDGNYIQDEARIQLKTDDYYDELLKLYNIVSGKIRFRGGKRKTRCNSKKYKKCSNTKTKKYKKRSNTKKNKRRNTKTKKHRK
jgi:hypothetical protein